MEARERKRTGKRPNVSALRSFLLFLHSSTPARARQDNDIRISENTFAMLRWGVRGRNFTAAQNPRVPWRPVSGRGMKLHSAKIRDFFRGIFSRDSSSQFVQSQLAVRVSRLIEDEHNDSRSEIALLSRLLIIAMGNEPLLGNKRIIVKEKKNFVSQK